MARTVAKLSGDLRLSDFLGVGILSRAFPAQSVKAVLRETRKESVRERLLPAHVTVYYVICLCLFMQASCQEVLRCLLEGLQWLGADMRKVPVAGDSGISQARRRIGAEPLQKLHDMSVKPIAQRTTRGAWYRKWRRVSLDGSTQDVADTRANAEAFGRPPASRGNSAFPQLRLVSLVENGTHVLFGTKYGPYRTSEATLAREAISSLGKDMLCLADRGFFSYDLWKLCTATEADLLWRVKRNLRLPVLKRLADGSYLSKVYPNEKARRHDTGGVLVRAIEYKLKGIPGTEPLYRLITTILDPAAAPATELAALYHDRWEIETAFDELKTHLRGRQIVLRSKTPELVKQEFIGLMLAHFAIRGLMHEAALQAKEDPDNLSYVHAVHVVRRKIAQSLAFFPSADESLP